MFPLCEHIWKFHFIIDFRKLLSYGEILDELNASSILKMRLSLSFILLFR